MNIHDVGELKYPETCWLEAIFTRQRELSEKYAPIERANGFHASVPPAPGGTWNLNDRFVQYLIKDYAWRFTEELGEAHECLEPYGGTADWINKPEVIHFREELIDALHFLTEMSICLGIGAENISIPGQHPSSRLDDWLLYEMETVPTVEDLHQKAFETVMTLGMAMNQLKNKPWKTTHQLTDVTRFRELVLETWKRFGELMNVAGFDAALVYDLYTRKSEVNAFRIRSKY